MRTVLLLLVVAACGDALPPLVSTSVTATDIRRIVVTGQTGSLRLDTGSAGEITYVARKGSGHVLRNQTLRIDHKGGGELRLLAPEGLDLIARLDEGDIGVGGKWGSIKINALKGHARVFVSFVRGGDVNTMTGDITLDCRLPPTESMTLTAVNGDVLARIAPGFRGLVQLAAPKGRVHLPAELARKNTDVGVMVFVGPGFTKEEAAKTTPGKRPGLWLTSKTGDVTFQLE